MKSTNFYRLIIPALVILFSGCMREVDTDVDNDRMVTIGYAVDGMRAGSYATSAEGHELAVNDIHILFYNMDAGSDGGYITYQHATVAHGTSTFSFPIPEVLVARTDYRTIIVGNAHDFVPAGFSSFDAYLDTCKNLTYDEVLQKLAAEVKSGNLLRLPMWGKLVDNLNQEVPFQFESRSNSTISGTIRLSRSICRLDLKNHVANKLNIAWVKVCNYRSQGYYFHSDAPCGEIKPNLSGVAPSGLNDGYVRVAEPSDGAQQLQAQLYAFPNIVSIVAQNDNQTTYLMIAGYYQDASGVPNTSKLTYYRFNMAELGGSQILKHNYIYRASIISVKGPGADTEQKAKDETTPLLEYQVDDDWEDNEGGSATDENGNYLFLSRTQVSFADGVKNVTELIKVKVREGMTWEVVADHTSTDRADAFKFMKSNATSFSITTLLDNASEQAYSGRLKVIATTKQGTKLELPVSLMQLSTADETRVLLVDGRSGTLNYQIAGSGSMLNLQVLTGSSYAKWTVEDSENSFTAWIGASFTSIGADKGFLNVTVPANITMGERKATLIVRRTGAADVILNLTQPRSDKLLTISPMPTNGELTIEGFDPVIGKPNGICFQKEFWVTLADPTNYTFNVTTDFDSNHDLILTKINPLAPSTAATFPGTPATSSLSDMVNGNKFWINVFRTGPGDPTIKGRIIVTAVPKIAGMATQELVINVDIVTSCIIDDVILDTVLIADRNIGAQARMNEAGDFVPARNFTNIPNVKITGYPDFDIENRQFKGAYYNWIQVTTTPLCPTEYADKNVDDAGTYSPYYKSADRVKWHAPSYELAFIMTNRIMVSKMRVFIIEDNKNAQGKYVGCYYPLAGYDGSPDWGAAYFWTTAAADNFRGYSGYCYPDRWGVSYDSKGLGLSVRCVRSL